MNKIVIISSGYLPVPAVKGGAVETLIDKLILSNEITGDIDLTVCSTYDAQAETISKKYKYTSIQYIKDNRVMEWLDRCIYYCAKKILKNGKHMSFRYILHRITYMLQVGKYLNKNEFDYVIIENTATLFWVLKLYNNRKKYQGKVIYHLHNEVSWAFGCKNIIMEAAYCLGVSQYINMNFMNRFPNYNESRLISYLNCIDVEHICVQKERRNEIREKYGYRDDDIVFIFAGRLCAEKGILELLNAFSGIELPNIKLLVVGNYYFGTNLVSEFERNLHNIAASIGNTVKFTGFVPNSEIGAYYSAADIAVLPSIWEEPAGLTIIEAMAASLPVITTNAGGIVEYAGIDNVVIIDRASNDFIINLRQEMKRLAECTQVRQELSVKSFERAKEFDYKNYTKKLVQLLKNDNSSYVEYRRY